MPDGTYVVKIVASDAASNSGWSSLTNHIFLAFAGVWTARAVGTARGVRAFGGVARFPLRVKCASLAWHALKSALDEGETVVTTDDGTGAGPEGA